MDRRLLLAAPLVLAALLACGHRRVSFSGDINWGKSAEEDYQAGREELADGHYEYAARFFEHVRTKYPFSKYVALADLALADVRFKQEHWTEAADAYKQFLKLHPNHEQADWAAFRIGAAYWNDGPSAAFIFPPPHEKELTQVHEAVKALQAFLQKYPESKHRAEGEALLARAQALQVQHEWYVVEFYRKRGRWPAVVSRLEGLLKDHPGSPRDAEALYDLAEAYLKLDERFRAQQALQQIILRHPDDPRRAQAEKLLASIR